MGDLGGAGVRRTRLYLLCFLPLIAFLVVLDVWRINGRVLDEQSGLPIAGARVLITFKEEGRRGIVPHTGRSGAECIRSFVETTDSNGRFSLTQFGFSFTWGQKRASFDTYVDGWYQVSTKRSSVGAFVLSPSTDVNVLLRRNSGQRWSFVHDGQRTPLTSDESSPLFQKTMSEDITHKADLLSSPICSYQGWPLLLEVLAGVEKEVRTVDERSYVRLRCEEMRRRADFLNDRKASTGGWRFRDEPTYAMLGSCDAI